MLTEEDIELIEKRLGHELQEDDLSLFQRKFDTDAEFKEEALLRSKVLAGIEAVEKEKIKKELKDLFQTDNNQEAELTKPSNTKRLYWIAAAVIVIPILFISIWTITSKPLTPDQLYTEYYQPLPDIISSRGSASNSGENKGMNFYNQRRYDSAIVYLQSIDDAKKPALLYLGISYMETNDFNRATTTLLSLKGNIKRNGLRDHIDWYLALSYLKSYNPEAAKNILSGLAQDTSSYYHEQSKQLLEDL